MSLVVVVYEVTAWERSLVNGQFAEDTHVYGEDECYYQTSKEYVF